MSGPEPVAPGDELEDGGGAHVLSEWCTDLDCPSNHAIPGLVRTGVNDYRCTTCGTALTTPMSLVFAHRRSH